MNYTYILVTLAQFVTALGNKPDGVYQFYQWSMYIYGFLTCMILLITVYMIGGFGPPTLLGEARFLCRHGEASYFKQFFDCLVDGARSGDNSLCKGGNDTSATFTHACSLLEGASSQTMAWTNGAAVKRVPSLCTPTDGQVYLLVALSVGAFFLCSAIHGEVHHVIAAFAQYFFFLPTSINVLMIYAFR